MAPNNRMETIRTIAGKCDRYEIDNVSASTDYYGEDVFNTEAMLQYLPKKAAEKLQETINNKTPFDPELAADVAHGMKKWALDKGVTHFTHWFQPLTGATAEKT